MVYVNFVIFCFKQKTAYEMRISDWSSDVCSSDLQPSRGTVTLDGAVLNGVAPYQRPVNMMFQSYALFPHMSVEQNVAFGLKQDGLPKDEIREKVADRKSVV